MFWIRGLLHFSIQLLSLAQSYEVRGCLTRFKNCFAMKWSWGELWGTFFSFVAFHNMFLFVFFSFLFLSLYPEVRFSSACLYHVSDSSLFIFTQFSVANCTREKNCNLVQYIHVEEKNSDNFC